MEVVPGISMLEMVIRKTRMSLFVHSVIVTTPDVRLNVITHCSGGLLYHWKGKRDVLSETHHAVDHYYHNFYEETEEPVVIVRITADCPLIRPEIIDKCVQEFLDRDVDLVYNSFEDTGADGSDVEVFSMSALELAHNNATEREHPTIWMRENLRTYYVETPFEGCSVDTIEDLQKVRQIFREGELR